MYKDTTDEVRLDSKGGCRSMGVQRLFQYNCSRMTASRYIRNIA